MIGVDLIGGIHRANFGQRSPIEEIVRGLALSRGPVRRVNRKRLVSPAFSDADGCAELVTLKRSIRSILRRC